MSQRQEVSDQKGPLLIPEIWDLHPFGQSVDDSDVCLVRNNEIDIRISDISAGKKVIDRFSTNAR